MSRADELRAQADAVEAVDRLSADYEAALDAYRANPSDAAKDAYKAAARTLAEARQASRAGRTGVGVGGDAVRSDNGSGG